MTITSQDMARPPASSARDIIRSSSPALLRTLGWAGIALSWSTTIVRAARADVYLHEPAADNYIGWYGIGIGLLACLLISWGQWTWTPFSRRRRDLEAQGWTPIYSWTMRVGYLSPQGDYVRIYSWGTFVGFLIVLFPDVFISHWEISDTLLMPFTRSGWPTGWFVGAVATLGIIAGVASIGPENVIFKKK